MNAVLPFLCLHFWSITFRIWVRSFRGMCEHCASKSSWLTVKGCNQTSMPCVRSSLFISFAGSRFPVAYLSWTVSIGFPHACLSLRVVTGSNDVPNFLEQLDWSVDLDVEDKLLLEHDDNPGTTRGTELSIVQVINFPFWANCGVSPFSTHMNIRVFEQSWWSNRIAGVSSSSCTVANGIEIMNKNLCLLVICTALVAVSRLWVLGLHKVSKCFWAQFSFAQHCALNLPNPYQTYDLLCLWRLFFPQENIT